MVYPTNKSGEGRAVILTLGDPSNDGHGQTSVVHFATQASDEELRQAYIDSKELFGFSMGQVAEEYEEGIIEPDQLARFKALGFTEKLEYEHDAEGGPITIDIDEYVSLFTFFMNKSLSETNRLILKPDTSTELSYTLGGNFGYGLFGS